MLCRACGREHANVATEAGRRSLECLECGDIAAPTDVVDALGAGRRTGELIDGDPPSDISSSAEVPRLRSEPNAWVESLKKAQQRCAALAEAAARDRAARAARRKSNPVERRAGALPLQTLAVPQSTIVPAPMTPEPAGPGEIDRDVKKFVGQWDFRTSRVASSGAATFGSSSEKVPLVAAGLTSVAGEPSEPVLQSTSKLPASPKAQGGTGEVVALAGVDSSPSPSQSSGSQQTQSVLPIAGSPSADAEESDAALQPGPAPDPLTSLQGNETQQHVPASSRDQPSPDDAVASPPADLPRSPMLRAMVGLLRTGFRSFDGLNSGR